MNKIKNFLAKHNNKESKIALSAALAVAVSSVSAFAGTASDAVKNLLGYVFGIFFYIGIVLLAWGVGQLVLAFKNEDGDSKSRAIMLIMAAIVLTSISSIFNGLGIFGQNVEANKEF